MNVKDVVLAYARYRRVGMSVVQAIDAAMSRSHPQPKIAARSATSVPRGEPTQLRAIK